MALATWWRGDRLPELPSAPGFRVERARDLGALAVVNGISVQEVERRLAEGHVPYAGIVDGRHITYGWAARVQAEIGELGTQFVLPPGDTYLWDFGTVPAWRGRGFYPQLLQRIVSVERAERFWIAYAPENHASKAGISKAGFTRVGHLSFGLEGRPVLIPYNDGVRGWMGSRLLGISQTRGRAWPCWECFQAGRDCCNPQRTPADRAVVAAGGSRS